MIKTIAVFIVFAVIGGAAVLLLSPTASFALPPLTTITTPLQPIITPSQSIVTRIQTMWSTIPSAIQGIVLLGLASAPTLFFAWTKSRAMDKLQQTQQQAATKIGELQGETLNAVSENTTLKQTLELKDQQIATYEQAQTSATQFTTQIDAQKQQIETLTGERNQMQRLFESKYLKPEEKPKVQ